MAKIKLVRQENGGTQTFDVDQFNISSLLLDEKPPAHVVQTLEIHDTYLLQSIPRFYTDITRCASLQNLTFVNCSGVDLQQLTDVMTLTPKLKDILAPKINQTAKPGLELKKNLHKILKFRNSSILSTQILKKTQAQKLNAAEEKTFSELNLIKTPEDKKIISLINQFLVEHNIKKTFVAKSIPEKIVQAFYREMAQYFSARFVIDGKINDAELALFYLKEIPEEKFTVLDRLHYSQYLINLATIQVEKGVSLQENEFVARAENQLEYLNVSNDNNEKAKTEYTSSTKYFSLWSSRDLGKCLRANLPANDNTNTNNLNSIFSGPK